MGKSKRLGSVVNVAKRNEENAARTMSEYRKILVAQEQRLAELKDYHLEYEQRFNQAANEGVEMRKINEYRHFLHKLNNAIDQQQDLVDKSRAALEQQNQHWTKQRVKHKSLDKVVSRHRTEEKRHRNRREQNESDDRAQRVINNPHDDIG